MMFRTGFASLLALTLAAAPVLAQEAETPAAPAVTDTLSTGEPVEPQVGQTYIQETVKDWSIRCVKSADGNDPCQMYQLLRDASGTPTSEMVLFKVGANGIAAGATIVTPLETLLTRGLTFSVSGGLPKRYPFNFCNQVGCVSQVGFTEEEVAQMKAGSEAQVVIVPARAQNSTVDLTISLAGFTAAFEKLEPTQVGQ